MTDPSAYISAHIQERLATEAHELGIRVDVRGDVVHLRGQVASEEQRRDVEEAARAAAEGHRICNEVSVFEVREPDREERIS
ncbi:MULTISPECIES: BON domain-containing protein [Actinomadura]|uniref:BON domain-containing protein n=2 Tax=Actinomadura TaxID=1988 RepID=A0ABW3ES06_9ACTN|nr:MULTISPECIES: BON domain-containing protein [Actinomadura]MBE1533278.1 hypothetical protein [Actinomadura algeriensis]RSN52140.1 BON domain-containing protein [Actinomadura sp. WAC 06369]